MKIYLIFFCAFSIPMPYQLGFKKGAQGGIHLMDEMLPLATKSIKKEDRIKKHALNETSF